MREIKAYVRPERLEAVVRALHDGGIGHLLDAAPRHALGGRRLASGIARSGTRATIRWM